MQPLNLAVRLLSRDRFSPADAAKQELYVSWTLSNRPNRPLLKS